MSDLVQGVKQAVDPGPNDAQLVATGKWMLQIFVGRVHFGGEPRQRRNVSQRDDQAGGDNA